MMISFKYAKKKGPGSTGGGHVEPETPTPEGICEPFPEHGIEWDEERIRAKGWVAVGRDEATKQYVFVSASGAKHTINVTTCIVLKFAKRV